MTTRYTMKPGDTVSRLAGDTGFAPETIWQHPDNATLRERREHMDVLAAGDEVAIPERKPRDVACATDKRHRFRRKGVPMPFVLQLLDGWGLPRKDRPFRLDVDVVVIEGTTDARGMIRVYVPTGARTGELTVDELAATLEFGLLEPADSLAGVRQRLTNLGFPCVDDAGGADSPGGATTDALLRFQQMHGLPATGAPDEATCARLGALYREPDTLSTKLTEVKT